MANDKTRDTRPARPRYWLSGRLRRSKARMLVLHNGVDPREAESIWEKARGGRRMNDGRKSPTADKADSKKPKKKAA